MQSVLNPKMNDELAQLAISAAFKGSWKKAIEINKKILKNNARDVEALNRLARAFAETGKKEPAIATSKKVLKIDPVNSIAKKCLTKWKSFSTDTKDKAITGNVDDFLEESGKTRIVKLLHTGDEKVVNYLDAGDEVKLLCYTHRVSVSTADNKYIGRLTDDISMRLINFIKRGYEYKVLVKSISSGDIRVFIREISRGKGMENIPSFPQENLSYIAYTPPHLVKRHETPYSEELQE